MNGLSHRFGAKVWVGSLADLLNKHVGNGILLVTAMNWNVNGFKVPLGAVVGAGVYFNCGETVLVSFGLELDALRHFTALLASMV